MTPASKHTPGPWTIQVAKPDSLRPESADDHGIIATVGGRQVVLAETYRQTANDISLPVEANARLIAASPDLLREVEQFFRVAVGMLGTEHTTRAAHERVARLEALLCRVHGVDQWPPKQAAS